MAAPKTATFVSHVDSLRLTRTGETPILNSKGDETGRNKREGVDFAGGRLTVSDDDAGEGTIKWLKEHPENGSLFHELGDGVTTGVPDSSDTLVELVGAISDGDTKRIQEIHDEESTTYSRPEVLAAAVTALQNAGKAPDAPPRPEHEVMRVRREPAVGIAVPPVDHPQPEDLGKPEGDDPDAGHVEDVILNNVNEPAGTAHEDNIPTDTDAPATAPGPSDNAAKSSSRKSSKSTSKK